MIHFVQSGLLIAKESYNRIGNKVPIPKEVWGRKVLKLFFNPGKKQKYSLEHLQNVNNPHVGELLDILSLVPTPSFFLILCDLFLNEKFTLFLKFS